MDISSGFNCNRNNHSLTGCSAVVARTAGGREVAGSIPVTPTKQQKGID